MSLKINLVIDGNYLVNKDVFILKKYRKIGEDLPLLLQKDFEKLTKIFPFDNIFFVSDFPRSWRKNVYKEYKENREKDDTIDWSLVWKEYNIFKESIKNNRKLHLVEVDYLEGDDLIAHIVKKSNKQGYSNLIIGYDSDLHQLLNFSITESYVNLMWNYKFQDEVLYVPKNYHLFFNHIEESSMKNNSSIFDLSDDQEQDFIHFFHSLVGHAKVKEVDSEESLFTKIISGDRKDNIPGIVKLTKKEIDEENGKGIGKEGAKKCYDLYQETFPGIIPFKDEEFIKNCSDICALYKDITNRDDIKEKMKKNINFNLKMLKLDDDYIPENVRYNMNEKLNYIFEKLIK